MTAKWNPPEPDDIVWCFFSRQPRDVPGPKPRPALVMDVESFEDGIVVTVAYGTSQKADRLVTREFAVRKMTQPAAYALAGLSYDTKFDLRKVIELPWMEGFFSVAPIQTHGQNPKLGSLHISLKQALAAATGAITGGVVGYPQGLVMPLSVNSILP